MIRYVFLFDITNVDHRIRNEQISLNSLGTTLLIAQIMTTTTLERGVFCSIDYKRNIKELRQNQTHSVMEYIQGITILLVKKTRLNAGKALNV